MRIVLVDYNLRQIVKQSKVGLAMNGLSQLCDVSSKEEFVVGLIRGFSGNMDTATQTKFAGQAFTWARESPPDPKHPLDTYCDGAARLLAFQTLVGITL